MLVSNIRLHEMENIKANQNHVFKSKKLSFRWSHFHVLDMTPI